VQLDPIKPTLKAPGPQRLKLEPDGPLSNFAFNFNLCRCNKGLLDVAVNGVVGRCRLTLRNPR
jgi:hypothetical protein